MVVWCDWTAPFTAAPIHEPSDSSLLWDAVRVMVRLLKQADILHSRHNGHAGPSAPRYRKSDDRGGGCACETDRLQGLHVDFDPHLRAFYFDACGFRPTDAGLIPLK